MANLVKDRASGYPDEVPPLGLGSWMDFLESRDHDLGRGHSLQQFIGTGSKEILALFDDRLSRMGISNFLHHRRRKCFCRFGRLYQTNRPSDLCLCISFFRQRHDHHAD